MMCLCLSAGGWRNGLLFDPLKKYGQFSYEDVMVNPLANALAASMSSDNHVYFGMQVRMVCQSLCRHARYPAL